MNRDKVAPLVPKLVNETDAAYDARLGRIITSFTSFVQPTRLRRLVPMNEGETESDYYARLRQIIEVANL